jgi:hypothetical protein
VKKLKPLNVGSLGVSAAGKLVMRSLFSEDLRIDTCYSGQSKKKLKLKDEPLLEIIQSK